MAQIKKTKKTSPIAVKEKKVISGPRNIILLLDAPVSVLQKVINSTNKFHDTPYRFMLLYDKKYLGKENKEILKKLDFYGACDFSSADSIIEAILLYKEHLMSVYCRTEIMIPSFQKVIPHIPYLRTPNSESLDWALNKYKMRKRFYSYDKKITPKFLLVKDQTQATVREIEKKVGFPLVVKPVGLAQSLLVNVVYHEQELKDNLRQVLKKTKNVYKDNNRKADPAMIVEQFIDGHMFSIDGYINSRGKIYFCPMVAVKTGKEIGFDDFFGYQQMTPTALTKNSIQEAEEVASKGVRALGLRSIVFHAELIKTDSGFKVVEIGPRIGGFRDDLYRLSYGINHIGNAVGIAIPRVPKINKRVLGHSAALKFFAKKEGVIKNIKGIKKAQELKSFEKIVAINHKVGDRVKFAKNGGKSVFNILLFNKDRSKLLADIRRLEKMIKIEVA